MPITGPKPKEQGRKVTRASLTHEWTEVPDVPFSGDRPDPGALSSAAARWWSVVSTMPHCILWAPSDWQFALDTLAIYRRFARDGQGAAELRLRERLMGTTIDARRDLRIRYLSAETESRADEAAPTDFLAARRARIMGDN